MVSTTGSAATNEQQIVRRGKYGAAMDLSGQQQGIKCHAEIDDHHRAIWSDHYIGRLDVPVDDRRRLCVSVLQGLADTDDKADLLRQRQVGKPVNDLVEALAI